MRVFLISTDDIPIQIPDELITDSQMIKDLLEDFNHDENEDLKLKTSLTIEQLSDGLSVSDYILCPDDTTLKIGISLINSKKLSEVQIKVIRGYPALLALAQFYKLVDDNDSNDATQGDNNNDTTQNDDRLNNVIYILTNELGNDVSDQSYQISLIRHICDSGGCNSMSIRMVLESVTSSVLHLWRIGYPLEALAFLLRGQVLQQIFDTPLSYDDLYHLTNAASEFNYNAGNPTRYNVWFAKEVITIIENMFNNDHQHLDSMITKHLEFVIIYEIIQRLYLPSLLELTLELKLKSVETVLRVINSHKGIIAVYSVITKLLSHNRIDLSTLVELDSPDWPDDDNGINALYMILSIRRQSLTSFTDHLIDNYDITNSVILGYINNLLSLAILRDDVDVAIELIDKFNLTTVTIRTTIKVLSSSPCIQRLAEGEKVEGIDQLEISLDIAEYNREELSTEKVAMWMLDHLSPSCLERWNQDLIDKRNRFFNNLHDTYVVQGLL